MPDRPNPTSIDAYAPSEIAHRIETVACAKAAMPLIPMLALSVLAGAFIAFGAMLYTVTVTDAQMGLGPTRLLGGLAFCLGLILVVVGGAELFTGNALMTMGWAHGKVSTGQLARNWAVVYAGNLAGAVAMAALVHMSGTLEIGSGAVSATAVTIAAGKTALPFGEAFVRGILCNALVCLAVWLCFAAHDVAGKILAILFPITAFVALGFEHSVANMYFIPLGILRAPETVTVAGFLRNLVPVTLGNIVGGGVFVALSYYVIYLRGHKD